MSALHQTAADPLGMDSEELRRLGYKMVDLVVERHQNKHTEPAILTGQQGELMAVLGGVLPEHPMDADQSLELLAQVALAYQQHGDHPRYFARVPGPASFAAILGEWLGVGFNTIASSWGGGSGPATVELVVIDWLRQFINLPEQTEGVLVSGGSLANLTAFAVARNELEGGIAYLTEQTHASLIRDLRQLGIADTQLRTVPVDDQLRMDITRLAELIQADSERGEAPWMVIASAGTTNTGSIDPLPEIADLCRQYGMWFHIDGAYGAPAAATEPGRALLKGLELADSVVLDPHKWLFQPYDIGACLITHPGALERCFAMYPEYLTDVQAQQAVNFGNRSLELTRRSRALKVWMALRTYGAEAFRAAIRRGLELAEFVEAELRRAPTVWEVVSPAQLGIICFALRGLDDAGQNQRAQAVSASGYACLTTTRIKGRQVLRLCTINPLTTEDDLQGVLARLQDASTTN